MKRIGFVGAGQMAKALAGGISANHVDLEFFICDPSDEAARSFVDSIDTGPVQRVASNAEVFANSDVVFLAVKPQYFSDAVVKSEVAPVVESREQPPIVVSVMAGVPIRLIRHHTSLNAIARVMPNTPCLVGEGAMAVAFSDEVDDESRDAICGFLESTGIVLKVDEEKLDAVTGLSGSGPAFVFEFIDALASGGVRCGLSRDVAMKLAIRTVAGAATLAEVTGEHPVVLRDRVTSPGGTTIAGLKAMSECGLEGAVIAAVEAATLRSRELGQS